MVILGRGLRRAVLVWASVALFVGAARVRPGDGVLERVKAGVAEDLHELVLDFVPFRSKVFASSGGRDVRLWSPSGGARTWRDGLSETVSGIRLFPLADRALTWSASGPALVWDVATGEVAVQLKGGRPRCARVFPRGDRVAVCASDGSGVSILDPGSGEELRRLHMQGVRDVAIFPSGDRLVSWGGAPSAAVWDAASGAALCRSGVGDPRQSHTFKVARVFPRGDRVASTNYAFMILIWDAATCRERQSLHHRAWVTGFAFAFGGEVLVSTGIDASIIVWNATSGRQLRRLRISEEYTMRPSFRFEALGDDRIIAAGRGNVLVIDIATGAVLHRLSEAGLRDFAVSPGGDVVATCAGRAVSVFDAATGAVLQRFEAPALKSGYPAPCLVAVGAGAAFDPEGFGPGVSWRELQGLASGALQLGSAAAPGVDR